jgi:hypothetical protein
MKFTRFITLWLAGCGLFAALAQAEGIVKFKARCSEDSLSITQAIERVNWAFKCGYITADDMHDALYSGAANAPRPRPEYPLFATADLSNHWAAPVDRNAGCGVPAGYSVQGFCTSSCYTPEQELWFPTGFVPIQQARASVLKQIVTLSPESRQGNLSFQNTPVDSYTMEFKDTWHDIIIFETQTGGELRVTTNHPLVDGEGRVRTADTFRVGDSLVHFESGNDPIVRLTKIKYFGKVYNVTPRAEDLTSQIVVAQGFLSGSAFYQNDGVNYLNRQILRRNLPESIIP